MFCSHCGKELADAAPLCPNCGTPTNLNVTPKAVNEVITENPQSQIFAILGFVFSMIGIAFTLLYCVFSFIYSDNAYRYAYYSSAPLFGAQPILTVFGILTGLLIILSFACCFTGIYKLKSSQQKKPLYLSIVGTIFASMEILLLLIFFMVSCIYIL